MSSLTEGSIFTMYKSNHSVVLEDLCAWYTMLRILTIALTRL